MEITRHRQFNLINLFVLIYMKRLLTGLIIDHELEMPAPLFVNSVNSIDMKLSW